MLILAALIVTTSGAGSRCAPLQPPVSGEVLRPYAPVGEYGGHWGVDFAAIFGTPVGASSGGTVTFAGRVGMMRSVTVSHGGGIRTSYSYLSQVAVHQGQTVATGATVGYSGLHHGSSAVHLSVRRDGKYFDPVELLDCWGINDRSLALLPSVGP